MKTWDIFCDFTGILAGAAFAALIILPCFGPSVRAELRLDITSGKVEPLPIAIPAFSGGARRMKARQDKI